MKMQLTEITPEIAKEMLERNKKNRNLRRAIVNKYVRDMLSGRWMTTHQGISFYSDGSLADGQHRLTAIMESGVTVKIMVATGLPIESGAAIDAHSARQAHDALRISGSDGWIGRDAVAIVRFILCDVLQNKVPSNGEIEQYAIKNEEVIRFSIGAFNSKKRGITTAGLQACVALAMHSGEPKDRLARFCEVILNGEMACTEENAAIRLREYMLFGTGQWSGAARIGTAKRAMRAIQLFCSGKPIAKLYEPAEFIYQAPEDVRE